MSRNIFSAVFLIGSLALGLFYGKPAWFEFQSLRNDTAELQARSAELDGLKEDRNRLLDILNSVSKADLDKLNQALPKSQQTADLLVLMEALAEKHSMGLSSIVFTPPPAPGVGQPVLGSGAIVIEQSNVQEFPLSFAVSGSYENFKEYLKTIEKTLRIIDVQSISFTAPQDRTQSNISILIKAKTYFQN